MTSTLLDSPKSMQTHLGFRGLIIFIAVMNMFIPLSIDLYLPALPAMGDYFQATPAVVNLTLVSFFFFFAIGILLFGPLSDKYGRKPILLTGLLIYSIASGLCAISDTIHQLILFRIVQALGAGSIIAVSLALVKDCFEGKTRDLVLALVQGMSVIAPMVAPILGAFILQFASWRETFWLLAILGILNLMAGILFQETLPVKDRYQGSISGSLARLLVVSKNVGFTAILIIFSLFMAPYMAYVAISSYVYISYFHLSAQSYSYFFAANSLFAILGPVAYLRLIHKITPKKFTQGCFAIALISGLCLLAAGAYSPWVFLIAFLPFTLVESAIRPLSTSILLDQQKTDTGSASSLINAVNTLFGSVGMLLGTMNWSNIVEGLGILIAATAVLAIIVWFALTKSKITVTGLS